jgi:serine/threonine protein phosphatase 1
MRLTAARPPEGLRLYAIGDIHGCLDQFTELHEAIADDLIARPVSDHRIVHLGDYVDRGADSAGIIEKLSSLKKSDSRARAIRGNHDQIFLEFLDGVPDNRELFLTYGGRQTLASYGCASSEGTDLWDLIDEAREAVPRHHIDFLRTLPLFHQFGDFFFCHAGVRPGVPLAEQNQNDLIWIREEFLTSTADHGAIVVHGHTPTDNPEVRPNRINVDTGAVFGGQLTCVVLEGAEHRFLQV